jgi:hypothetical protein
VINFDKFDKFNFKVVLNYKQGSTSLVQIQSAEKLSAKMTALWKAPYHDVSSKRYSARDKGDDSWSSVSMYNWIQANINTGLWSRYNDVSGEHTLNLGHATHELGNHVDIFHYYTLDATSGGENFSAFLTAVKSKVISKVKSWIEEHRKQFDLLNSDNQVVQFITHRGNPINTYLTNNWLRFLMEKGKIDNYINLGLNSWTSSTKVKWASDHTDHIHIQIK